MKVSGEEGVFAGWHLRREIQLGHIMTTLTIAASVFWYVAKMEQRISLLEAQFTTQHDRDERQDRNTAEAMALLRAQLDRMDAKLDRLIEKK